MLISLLLPLHRPLLLSTEAPMPLAALRVQKRIPVLDLRAINQRY